MLLDAGPTITAIDEAVAERGVATQPFARAWAEGRLTRDDLRAFAPQFHHLIDGWSRAISTVHAGCRDEATRRALIVHLQEVELHTPSLAGLWLQTSAALGLFSDSVRQAPMAQDTEACINDLRWLCREGTVSGLATLYAWAAQLGPLARAWQSGLVDHYDMPSGPGLEFFEVAATMANSLRRGLSKLLADQIRSSDQAEAAVHAAGAAITAVNGLVSGAGRVATA
jgi:pyrroloquinoline-quinone synthase